MKSTANLDIEMIGIIEKKVAGLEIKYLELIRAEKILSSEFALFHDKSKKYKNVHKNNVRKIINYLINEYPLLLFYSDEFGIVSDIRELFQVLSYNEVLDRSIFAIKKIIEDLSKEIIETKKLTWEKLTLTKPEYEIVCDKLYELLKEGDLCLDKKNTELYRIIGDFYYKDEENVKRMINKYKERYPELIQLWDARKEARFNNRSIKSTKSIKKSKRNRK